MDTPSPDQLRERSPLLAAAFPAPDGDEALVQAAEVVAPVVADLTGRSIGGAPGEEVPDYLIPVAERAIALKVGRIPSTAAAMTKAAKALNVRSVSAGPWSESYFGPGEAAQIKRLDPDPELHELLWALATADKRAYWTALWSGTYEPAVAVQTFNWRGRR